MNSWDWEHRKDWLIGGTQDPIENKHQKRLKGEASCIESHVIAACGREAIATLCIN